MTKHFCDRCGDELGATCFGVSIATAWRSGARGYDVMIDACVITAATEGTKELCEPCGRYIQHEVATAPPQQARRIS